MRKMTRMTNRRCDIGGLFQSTVQLVIVGVTDLVSLIDRNLCQSHDNHMTQASSNLQLFTIAIGNTGRGLDNFVH